MFTCVADTPFFLRALAESLRLRFVVVVDVGGVPLRHRLPASPPGLGASFTGLEPEMFPEAPQLQARHRLGIVQADRIQCLQCDSGVHIAKFMIETDPCIRRIQDGCPCEYASGSSRYTRAVEPNREGCSTLFLFGCVPVPCTQTPSMHTVRERALDDLPVNVPLLLLSLHHPATGASTGRRGPAAGQHRPDPHQCTRRIAVCRRLGGPFTLLDAGANVCLVLTSSSRERLVISCDGEESRTVSRIWRVNQWSLATRPIFE